METHVYRRILENTLKTCYPNYLLQMLFKYLDDKGVVRNDGRTKIADGIIDITNKGTEKAKLEFLFDKLPTIYKEFEQYEYERVYRYSYLFKINSINYRKIPELIKEGRVTSNTDSESCDDILSSGTECPTYKEENGNIYFKFNIRLTSAVEGKPSIKHVVLVVINKDNNFMEIRQDVVPAAYNVIDKFYETYARSAKAFIARFLNADIDNVNIEGVVRYMDSNKKEEVKVTAMRLRKDGMDAFLDASSNDKLKIPILDELKEMLNEEIFNLNDDNVINIKKRIEAFIEETIEVASLPSAKVFWIEAGHKVHVFGEENIGQLSYIKWLGDLKGKGSMDYVAGYIMQCERELKEKLDS